MQNQTDAKGVIFDQYSQKAIRDAIEKCRSYSQLLKLLLTCGFDLGIPDLGKNPCQRCHHIISDGAVKAGMSS